MKIGVLACQECYWEQIQAVEKYGLVPVEIRTAEDLDTEPEGLIISGEEGPEFYKLLNNAELLRKIKEKAEGGLVIYGINEGVTVLKTLDLMNITVERKAVKQQDSVEATLTIPALGEEPVRVEFTGWPPCIIGIEPNVGILCSVGDSIAMVRQGNFLASTFNPRFIDDLRVHEYFFRMVKDAKT